MRSSQRKLVRREDETINGVNLYTCEHKDQVTCEIQWKAGQSLHEIGRAFGKAGGPVFVPVLNFRVANPSWASRGLGFWLAFEFGILTCPPTPHNRNYDV
jgi:hypothetical protein